MILVNLPRPTAQFTAVGYKPVTPPPKAPSK
jgi:hypothetical protein